MTPRLRVGPLTLLGEWSFSRVIDDRLTGMHSTVDGTTDLVAEDATHIRWAESGTLALGYQKLPVSRVLNIVFRDGGWIVTFEDGRYFHPWEPGDQVQHQCGADLYVGRVDVEDDARWTVEWQVTGPRKDYTMTTVLSRAGTP